MRKPKNYNVYRSKFPHEDSRTSRIADRMDEESVALLIRARKQFGLTFADISRKTGFKYEIVRSIFRSHRYCRKGEYPILYDTMRRMILRKVNMTAQEAMQKIRAMEAGNEC